MGKNARGRAQRAEAETPKPRGGLAGRWRDWVGQQRKWESGQGHAGDARATGLACRALEGLGWAKTAVVERRGPRRRGRSHGADLPAAGGSGLGNNGRQWASGEGRSGDAEATGRTCRPLEGLGWAKNGSPQMALRLRGRETDREEEQCDRETDGAERPRDRDRDRQRQREMESQRC